MLLDFAERKIAENYDEIVLDASLPAKMIYRKRGYIETEGHAICTDNGDVDGQTKFFYHQKGNIIWSDYSVGEVKKGFLVGTVDEDGKLEFTYQHINIKDEARLGKCVSMPVILENGRIELHEEWQWLNGDMSKGSSVIVEV